MKVTTSDRLQELMNYYGITQSDISRRTKIPKTTLSQYVLGKRVPKQNILTILAETYNVSEPWLMGYDVPMDKNIEFSLDGEKVQDHLKIIDMYTKLNEENKREAMNYISYLVDKQKE